MEILTVREHQYINVSEKRNVEKNIISFKDKSLLYDIDFKNIDNQKEYVFDIRRDKVRVKSFVGSIYLENSLIIEILPKFSNLDNENLTDEELSESIKNSREIFIKMLVCSDSVKFLHLNDSKSSNEIKTMPLVEVFIYLFAKNLLLELQVGLNFNYEKREENLHFIKGRFLAHKNLRENLIDKSRFVSEFFEYSKNNLLMKIFKSAIYILLNKVDISYRVKSIFREILFILDEVEFINFNLNLFDMVSFDRTNDRFETLSIQLKSIMSNLTPFTSDINPNNFWSILFDMNELFEKFIAYQFKRNSIDFIEQKSIDIYQLQDSLKKVIARPDFILLDSKEKEIGVVEAKWKMLKDEKNLLGLYASDFWQLSSYMNYTNSNQLNGYFIVPKNSEDISSEFEFSPFLESNKSIKVLALDFSKDWEQLQNSFFEIEKDKLVLKEEKIDEIESIEQNSESDKLTFPQIAKKVLIENDNKPLTANEIWNRGKELYSGDGKTPLNTMSAILGLSIKNKEDIFDRVKESNNYRYFLKNFDKKDDLDLELFEENLLKIEEILLSYFDSDNRNLALFDVYQNLVLLYQLKLSCLSNKNIKKNSDFKKLKNILNKKIDSNIITLLSKDEKEFLFMIKDITKNIKNYSKDFNTKKRNDMLRGDYFNILEISLLLNNLSKEFYLVYTEMQKEKIFLENDILSRLNEKLEEIIENTNSTKLNNFFSEIKKVLNEKFSLDNLQNFILDELDKNSIDNLLSSYLNFLEKNILIDNTIEIKKEIDITAIKKDNKSLNLEDIKKMTFLELEELSQDFDKLEKLDYEVLKYLILDLKYEELKKEFKITLASMNLKLVDKNIAYLLSIDEEMEVIEELIHNSNFDVSTLEFFDLYFNDFIYKEKIEAIYKRNNFNELNFLISFIEKNFYKLPKNSILGMVYIKNQYFDRLKSIIAKLTNDEDIVKVLSCYYKNEVVLINLSFNISSKNSKFDLEFVESILDKLARLEEFYQFERDETLIAHISENFKKSINTAEYLFDKYANDTVILEKLYKDNRVKYISLGDKISKILYSQNGYLNSSDRFNTIGDKFTDIKF